MNLTWHPCSNSVVSEKPEPVSLTLAPEPPLSWALGSPSWLWPYAESALYLEFSGPVFFHTMVALKNTFLAANGCLPAVRKREEELAASHLRTSTGIDLSQQKEPGIFLPN